MVLVTVDTQLSVPSLISEVKCYSFVIAAACGRPQRVLYGDSRDTLYIWSSNLFVQASVFDSGQENDRRWNKISQHIVEMNRFNSARMCSCVYVIGSKREREDNKWINMSYGIWLKVKQSPQN